MRSTAVCLLTLALFSGVPAAPAAGGVREGGVEVTLTRAQVQTRLGERFGFDSTIRNLSGEPQSGLVAHLNIVGLSKNIYVDPEDWSEERTKNVPPLAPGETASLGWSVKAVTGGEAAIYVVVLPGHRPADAREGLAVSSALDVDITERRTLNSGGVLPLALGVPAFLGLVAVVARRRRRR